MSYPVCARPEFRRSKQPKNRPKADCLLLWSRRSSAPRLRTDKSTLLHDPFGEDDSRVGSVNVKEDRQQKLTAYAVLSTSCGRLDGEGWSASTFGRSGRRCKPVPSRYA